MTTLYRPVGAYELVKVAALGWRDFPPRLPEQPIFYPVLDRSYGAEIAGQWNPPDPNSAFMGFLTTFEVPDQICAEYQAQVVGGRRHRELWVPAEDQSVFMGRASSSITVIEAWSGPRIGEVLPSWAGAIGHLGAAETRMLIDAVLEGPLLGGPLTG